MLKIICNKIRADCPKTYLIHYGMQPDEEWRHIRNITRIWWNKLVKQILASSIHPALQRRLTQLAHDFVLGLAIS